MTDEEMAEAYYYYKTYPATLNIGGEEERKKSVIDIFLAGLTAGRPQWHKVADGDLPDNLRYVWTNEGPGYYDDNDGDKCWRDDFGRLHNVVAWCEPKFEKEGEHISSDKKLNKAKELLRFWVNDFYDNTSNQQKYEARHKAIVETESFLKE